MNVMVSSFGRSCALTRGEAECSVYWSRYTSRRTVNNLVHFTARAESVSSLSEDGKSVSGMEVKILSSRRLHTTVLLKTSGVVKPFEKKQVYQLCHVVEKNVVERVPRLRSYSKVSRKGRTDFSRAQTWSCEDGVSGTRRVLNVKCFGPAVTSQRATPVQEKLVRRLRDLGCQNVVPSEKKNSCTGTLYLVDIHPLCYEGKRPRPTAILKWMKLLFNQVTHEDPVIAVMDGEKGNDYRRRLLPGYKAKRNKYKPLSGIRGPYFKGDEMDLREAFPLIQACLAQCNMPVLKVEDAEADDVVATLMHQAVSRGMRVVVASPDMDFRQLLSKNVNMLLPVPEFGRWSFYTLEQYIVQNTCDPSLDLGLRCILGDSSDNVPGLPDVAPGFGRKTALKLMKKHGTLENLLVAAKTRTVGRPYIQEALTQHADILYRNLQVLKLRRDVDITLKEEWCRHRDRSNEVQAFQMLEENLLRKTLP